jgi:cytochrome c oxidase cbb3-type subunit 1
LNRPAPFPAPIFHLDIRNPVEPFVRNFIRMSLVWFAIGILLGLAMIFWPAAIIYRPAHVHAHLLGFVSMMIFGVAYHVLPRFTGRPLHSPTLAFVHFWAANVGVLLMLMGFIARAHIGARALVLLGSGAALSALAGAIFVYNAWRTLGPNPARNAPATITLKQRAS